MLSKLRFLKTLLRDLPQYGKLAYCLLRDARVPARNKALFGAGLAVGLNPFINLPEMIPVVGELDTLAITLVALRLFIASCPEEYVEEHKQLLVEQRSRFDEDLRAGEYGARILLERLRHRERGASPFVDVTEPAHTTTTPAATDAADRPHGVSA